jgi:predicted phage terminase large subunit-like protein
LVGRVLEDDGDKWTVVNLPALAEDDDVLGRVAGEPLWPEWYGVESLADMFGTLDPREWAALYQGKPIAEGGNLFKGYWWKTYRELPVYETVVQYWDTAYEITEGRSYSVCTTWAVCQDGYYLVHVFRERLEYPELKSKVEELANKFTPSIILVEKRASGMSLIQDLQRTTRYTVEAINVVKDKVSRAMGVTAVCAGGRVVIPELAPWVDSWKAEMEEFPGGKYDDQVDSTVGAITYMRDNFTFSTSSAAPQVEMGWDVYRKREGDQILRDWDIYGKRHLHG